MLNYSLLIFQSSFRELTFKQNLNLVSQATFFTQKQGCIEKILKHFFGWYFEKVSNGWQTATATTKWIKLKKKSQTFGIRVDFLLGHFLFSLTHQDTLFVNFQKFLSFRSPSRRQTCVSHFLIDCKGSSEAVASLPKDSVNYENARHQMRKRLRDIAVFYKNEKNFNVQNLLFPHIYQGTPKRDHNYKKTKKHIWKSE